MTKIVKEEVMNYKKGSQPAFPGKIMIQGYEQLCEGITYRQYLAAHAPKEVPNCFFPGCTEECNKRPVIGDTKYCIDSCKFSRIARWPWAWADMVLEAEGK